MDVPDLESPVEEMLLVVAQILQHERFEQPFLGVRYSGERVGNALLHRAALEVSGAETRDPRLEAIDLRAALRMLDIEALGAPGEAAPEGFVEFRRAGRDEPLRGLHFREGRVRLLAHTGALDLAVHADGYRSVRLPAVDADVRVRLEPGIPVRVSLPEGLERPPGTCILQLVARPLRELEASGATPLFLENGEQGRSLVNWRREHGASFDAGGTALLALPEEGTYRLEWTLASDGQASVGLSTSRGQQSLEVRDTRTILEVTLGPDPEDYRARLADVCGGR